MSDAKMSREDIVALLAMIELRVGDPDGWDVGAVSEIVKRAAFMITALEAERDAKRAEVDELLYLRAEDEALIRNLEAERDEAREALTRIKQWADAYPIDLFPPLDDNALVRARSALDGAGVSIGALHAAWARRITRGIGEIAAAALANGGRDE